MVGHNKGSSLYLTTVNGRQMPRALPEYPRGGGPSTGIKCLDLQSYFLNPGGSSFIQDENDRLVGRILIGANENLD